MLIKAQQTVSYWRSLFAFIFTNEREMYLHKCETKAENGIMRENDNRGEKNFIFNMAALKANSKNYHQSHKLLCQRERKSKSETG